MQRNEQDSSLLRLPLELRIMIYDFAIDTGGVYDKITHDDYPEWTSRQLFAELARGYYISKMLKFRHMPPISHSISALDMAVASFTPEQKKFIGAVYITWDVLVGLGKRLDASFPLLQLGSLFRITTVNMPMVAVYREGHHTRDLMQFMQRIRNPHVAHFYSSCLTEREVSEVE
jgi:hypothetical protein